MPILNDIIDWVEDKPAFWQIGIDRLIRNNHLTDSDISELIKICKSELALSKFEFDNVDFDDLRDFANNTVSKDNIVLSKISNIDNINALSKEEELEFPLKGLSVIYGDNGAGKSSYVSILKHICNTRGVKPSINDNLFDPSSKGRDKKAKVEYTIDGINFNSVELKNEEVSDSILKSVDVFDAFSANHYIEGEDEIAFIPKGFSIIEKFAIYLKRIENVLKNEIKTLELSNFDYSVIQLEEGTSAKEFLNNLNSKTTLQELRTISQYNEDKADRIVELNKIIPRLKSTDPKITLKSNEEKIKRFNILINKFQLLENVLIGNSLVNIKNIINKYVATSVTLKATSEKTFSDLPLSGIGNDSWKQLWESARKFYNQSKEQKIFPVTDKESNCPLCLQILSTEAKKRFTNFEEFVKMDVQKEYDKAYQEYTHIKETLNYLSFDFIDQEPTINELEELITDYLTIQESYLEILSNQNDYLNNELKEKKIIELLTEPKIENSAKTIIENVVAKLEKENEKLETQSIEEQLKPYNKEFLELTSEKKIYDIRPKLAKEILRQKKNDLLNQCCSRCNTRAITMLSNQLAAAYISKNLRRSFQQELQKLGFRDIQIVAETRGEKGKQYHYLKLNEPNAVNVALKDILSEGEHRCIALSTFLSELSLSDHYSSIIFDDPVSSLDHKWRNKIAKRITEESINRQVIVFTHDITFLMMLQEHSEKLSCNLEINSLTRKKTETGIIAKNPPWDALTVKKPLGEMV